MNIGQTELIGLSLLQSNISFPSAGIRDMSEERWTVIRQRGLWSSMTTLHIYIYDTYITAKPLSPGFKLALIYGFCTL